MISHDDVLDYAGPSQALLHGGRVRQAAREEGIPPAQWLDLSTGINPLGWPVPAGLPEAVWRCLPEDDDALHSVAAAYYGSLALLPVAGSQAVIQALPGLWPAGRRVGVLAPSYGEHAHAWRGAGHEVVPLDAAQVAGQVARLEVLVLVNPNNPTGAVFAPSQLRAWHEVLAQRGGCLVVDEAFMDCTPALSLAGACPRRGLVVLRSLGKFFGLAGARVGFVLAEARLLDALAQRLGPWCVSGPGRWAAAGALADSSWQVATRQRLALASARLQAVLQRHQLSPRGGTALFQWVCTPAAPDLYQRLRQVGILTRLFTEPLSVRFGLPGDASQWARLEAALAQWHVAASS